MGSRGLVATLLLFIVLSSDFLIILAYYTIRSSYQGCSCDEIILRINCSGVGMQSLPIGLPDDYYSLYFDNNNLTVLNEEIFNLSSLPRIRELSIVASNVHFVEDDVLASLTSLVWLDMRHNFLRVVPYGIDRMTRLQMLDLSGNFITSIPLDTFIDHGRLTTLFLEDNLIDISLIDRGAFSALINMRKLSISLRMNELYSQQFYSPSYSDGEPSYSSPYEGGESRCLNVSFWFDEPQKGLFLSELKLTNNGISCVSRGAFSDWFGDLQNLNLGHNGIKSLTDGLFVPLIHLEELNLEANQLEDIPDGTFSANTALRVLSLTGNRLVNFPDSLLVPASSTLEWLDVSKNSLNAWDGTAHDVYYRLEHIDLTSNSISGDGPISFTNIPHLRSLTLGSNILRYFPNVTRLRHLEVLKLSGNRIKVIPGHALHGCRRLKELEMRHNLLRTISESAVSAPKHLEVLDISSNPLVCDCNIKWLGSDINKLSHAYYNMVYTSTCASPKFLQDFPLLEVLENQITELICNEYSDPSSMKRLVAIWLSVLGLIVCFNVYKICSLTRRRLYAMMMEERVSEHNSTFPGLLRRKKASSIIGEVVVVAQEQSQRLSSTSYSESPIRTLPSSSHQWAKIPETQV